MRSRGSSSWPAPEGGPEITTQEIDTTTSAGRLVFRILVAGMAEMERELIRERVQAGMVRTHEQGKRLGRPRRSGPVTEDPMWSEAVEGIEAGHLNWAEAARNLMVHRASLDDELRSVQNWGIVQVAFGRDRTGRMR